MTDLGIFRRLIDPIKNRVFNMLARSVVNAIDDTTKTQIIKAIILKDDPQDGIEHIQEYGFTSVALPGAEALLAFISGNRDHGIAITVGDKRFRLKGLKSGEVALYTDEGDSIIFKRGRNLEINAGTKATITTPNLFIVGNVAVTGNITATGDVSDGARSMTADRALYNAHTHQDLLGNPDPLEPPTPQQ